MSDYTKTTNFTAKDNLTTGDPLKVIKGSYFDTEFDNIVTAIATKYDSNDRASEAEAEALTSNVKLLTPLRLDNVFKDNAGTLSDIQALSDPGADRVLFWDESDNAVEWLSIDSTLSISGNTLSVQASNLNHDALTNFVANEHINHGGVDITAGTGLTGGGDITSSRTLDLDISGLSGLNMSAIAASDSILVNDGGTMKQMTLQNMGVRVVTLSTAQTFALGDATSLQLLTGATDRTWTIPTNAAVAFHVGTVIYVGTRDAATLSLSPDSGVTLTSVNASGNSDQDVSAGGLAALIKVDTNEWMLAGDIA